MKHSPATGYATKDYYLLKHCGSISIIQLQFDNDSEPPSADPHARWYGGRGLDTLSYPIWHC